MNPSTAVAGIQSIQGALQILTALYLTSTLLPPQAQVHDGATYDFIIVGGGTAGCVIANRLTEENFNVLLIEAGGDPPVEATIPGLVTFLPYTQYDWSYTAKRDDFVPEGHQNKQLYMTQGRMLGGTDSIGFMVYVRGSPSDYDSWAESVGDQSWNYEHVLPYFKKSENLKDEEVLNSPYGKYHGTDGYLKVKKMSNNITVKYFQAIKELGHKVVLDTNGIDQFGFTQPLVTAVDGMHQSTAYAFLSPVKNRRNLHVLKNALVTKILFDDQKNAIGVKVSMEDHKTFLIKAAKEVILSAGAINTPQLLMLSGIGPKQHLEQLEIEVIAELPVGENLQDHRMCPLIHKGIKSDDSMPKSDPFKVPISAINGFVALDKTQKYPDYETVSIVNPHDSPALLQICTFTFKYIDEVCEKIFAAGKGREVIMTFIDHMLPESRGKIRLRSKNPRDHPLIHLGFYTDPIDLENHARYVADFNRIVETDYFKSIDGEFVDVSNCGGLRHNEREFWQCYVKYMAQTVWHYSSSCSMGKVVDSKLKVYGVQKLRIADASIMPYITRGNTLAPVIMIAEKASDMIKQDHGCHHSEVDQWVETEQQSCFKEDCLGK